jgi:hypothetical protein
VGPSGDVVLFHQWTYGQSSSCGPSVAQVLNYPVRTYFKLMSLLSNWDNPFIRGGMQVMNEMLRQYDACTSLTFSQTYKNKDI